MTKVEVASSGSESRRQAHAVHALLGGLDEYLEIAVSKLSHVSPS